MIRTKSLSLIGGTLAFGLAIGAAQATPLSSAAVGAQASPEDHSWIQVHECNRVCERGPVEEWGGAVRWHRHAGKACRPVHCTPRYTPR